MLFVKRKAKPAEENRISKALSRYTRKQRAEFTLSLHERLLGFGHVFLDMVEFIEERYHIFQSS